MMDFFRRGGGEILKKMDLDLYFSLHDKINLTRNKIRQHLLPIQSTGTYIINKLI